MQLRREEEETRLIDGWMTRLMAPEEAGSELVMMITKREEEYGNLCSFMVIYVCHPALLWLQAPASDIILLCPSICGLPARRMLKKK